MHPDIRAGVQRAYSAAAENPQAEHPFPVGRLFAESLGYSLGMTWQDGLLPEIGRLERSPTAWRPYLWPIKLIMFVGFLLMLLQSIAALIRDIATLRGEPL